MREAITTRQPIEQTVERAKSLGAARVLDKIIFYALLVVIALTAIPYGTVEPWWEAIYEIAIFALTALWMIEIALTGKWRIEGIGLLAPLFALVIFAYLQTIPLGGAGTVPGTNLSVWRAISADPYETRLFVLHLIALALTLGLLLNHTWSPRRLRMLILLVIGIGMTTAIFGIVRQTTQRNTPGFGLPYLMPGIGYGQFINRNHFALLMEMALGLTLALVIGGGVRRERTMLYLAAVLPVWTALVLSNSRGGIFSMLCQLILIAILFTSVRSRPDSAMMRESTTGALWKIGNSLVARALLIVVLISAVAVGVVWVGGDPLVSHLENAQTDSGMSGPDDIEGASRAQIWRATWAMVKDHPVAGVGFSGYWVAIPEYHQATGRLTPQQAHNEYLELLASGGIIGVAIGLWFAVELIRRLRAPFRSTDPFRRAVSFGALVGLAGVALHSFVDFGLHITINAAVFIVLITLATVKIPGDVLTSNARRRRRRRSKSSA